MEALGFFGQLISGFNVTPLWDFIRRMDLSRADTYCFARTCTFFFDRLIVRTGLHLEFQMGGTTPNQLRVLVEEHVFVPRFMERIGDLPPIKNQADAVEISNILFQSCLVDTNSLVKWATKFNYVDAATKMIENKQWCTEQVKITWCKSTQMIDLLYHHNKLLPFDPLSKLDEFHIVWLLQHLDKSGFYPFDPDADIDYEHLYLLANKFQNYIIIQNHLEVLYYKQRPTLSICNQLLPHVRRCIESGSCACNNPTRHEELRTTKRRRLRTE